MARLTKAERDQLPAADFAWPERRMFAIHDGDDVADAARLLPSLPDAERSRVRAGVLEICRRKGLSPPSAWANLSAEVTGTVEFASEASGELRYQSGTVRRKAPVIFRIKEDGDYTFKHGAPFNLTPEEVLACCADFSPVPIDDNHRPTHGPDGNPAPPSYFAGKLGKVVSLQPSADCTSFGGEIEVPRWLDAMHQGEPIRLSARFDRATKKLRDVAITPNPRIGDAAAFGQALFAAFAMDEAVKAVGGAPGEGEKGTPHGQKLMQYMHDMTAHCGAKCREDAEHRHGRAKGSLMAGDDGAPGNQDVVERQTAKFAKEGGGSSSTQDAPGGMAPHESSAVQKIHDLVLGSGAACAIYKSNLGKNKEWRPGQHYKTEVDAMPPYSAYRPGQYALMGDARGAAFSAIYDDAEKSPREKALEEELRFERQKASAEAARRIGAEAAAFAASVRDRITPAQAGDTVRDYQQAALDDLTHGGLVSFSDDRGGTRQGTRVEMLRARYARMLPHRLTVELLPSVTDVGGVAGQTGAVAGAVAGLASFANPADTMPEVERELAEAKKKTEEYAARVNAARNGARRNGKA